VSQPPSLAELRPACQPASVFNRANAEHWAGPLYMRKVSIHLTRQLLRTPISPDGVTWLMIASGLLAALALTVPGPAGAVLCVLLVQGQLLLDCSDGEVARWQQRFSPSGVYLDRIGHYSTEAALPVALGIRADGGWGSIGGWTTLGLVCAVLHLLTKAETDLVHVARGFARLPLLQDVTATARPQRSGLARVRGLLRFVPFFRAFIAVEFSFLVLLAAAGDLFVDGIDVTRALLVVLVPLSFVIAAGHLLGVLSSRRLRP
jgi:phosphatidylglycerophosphate synthase